MLRRLAPAEGPKPQLTIKQAFKKDEVICMICNKEFKTLKRHLTMSHQLKPGEYRKQFGSDDRCIFLVFNWTYDLYTRTTKINADSDIAPSTPIKSNPLSISIIAVYTTFISQATS